MNLEELTENKDAVICVFHVHFKGPEIDQWDEYAIYADCIKMAWRTACARADTRIRDENWRNTEVEEIRRISAVNTQFIIDATKAEVAK